MLNSEERMFHHSKPHKSVPDKQIYLSRNDLSLAIITHHNKSHNHKDSLLNLVLENKSKNLKLTDGKKYKKKLIVSKKKINNSEQI